MRDFAEKRWQADIPVTVGLKCKFPQPPGLLLSDANTASKEQDIY